MPATKNSRPRIGAHTPTSGGMAKRSIEYARITEAEAINKSYTDFFNHLQHLGAKVDIQ